MRIRLASALAAAVLLSSPAVVDARGRSQTSSREKSVYVSGHYTKSGHYVAPYYRSAPGTADHSRSSGSSYRSLTYRSGSHTKRDPAERRAFMREHPCPSTGKTSGTCPGYVVDHIQALKHGGRDDPSNMQRQTIEAAKAKDRWE